MNSRFLYLIGQLGPGGSERQLFYLLQYMDREKYRPAVAVWNFSQKDIYVQQIRARNVRVFPLTGARSSATKLAAFRTLVKELKPEVVHSYSFFTNIAVWWGTVGTQAVAVGSVRSDFLWAKQDCGFWLGKLSARWPGVQIFNNFAAAKRANCYRGIFAPKQPLVVRNAIDFNSFQPAQIPEGPLLIVGVGSLTPVKRWDRLLRAASELKRQNLDFVVQIVGEGTIGGNLNNLAQDLSLNGRVRLTGYEDDVASLLRKASFVVHTSESEGCPNVILEAMACGRAVVATGVGDIPFVVEEGRTGFIVRPGDDAALVERMARLIRDRDLCREMGEAGRAKAQREFGLDRLVVDTLAAYRAAGWKET